MVGEYVSHSNTGIVERRCCFGGQRRTDYVHVLHVSDEFSIKEMPEMRQEGYSSIQRPDGRAPKE